jgi:hypothetical protein
MEFLKVSFDHRGGLHIAKIVAAERNCGSAKIGAEQLPKPLSSFIFNFVFG